MHNFPKILKELRDEKNLTQTQLAHLLGYKSETTISQWETGKRTPELENLITIAKFFNVTIDYLVGVTV